MKATLTIDDLDFEVRRSPRRRTLEITVDREGELILSAPDGCDEDALVSFVREKRLWVYTKLAEKDRLRLPKVEKSFVNGEGFLYLGRSYRLLLVEVQGLPLRLDHGRFRLRRDEVADGREQFVHWYRGRGRAWLRPRVAALALRMGVIPEGVEVRDLGYRWGSSSRGGRLNFHWVALQLPASLVEYVIVHELAHLQEPHHTPEYWLRVERVMPDYEARKRSLAEWGARVWR